MENGFEKLKWIYENIYNITLEIGTSILNDQMEQVGVLLNKRGDFITQGENIFINTIFSEKEKEEIAVYKEKINLLESENMEKMRIKYEKIEKNISQLNVNQKAISAYKSNKENTPVIIDSRE